MHHFLYRNAPWPTRGPPTIIEINDMSRYNLGHPNPTENNTPNSGSHITMKKKVVHRFPIFLHASR
jgi:hypothetical protein